MSLKVWGPLLITIILFAVATGIKFFAFAATDMWLTIAPELALWSTGVLFSLSVARAEPLSAKAVPQFTPNPATSSASITYAVQVPSRIESYEKYLYSFAFSMALWIFTVLINGHCVKAIGSSTAAWPPDVWWWNTAGLGLGGMSVGIAIWFLFKEAA